MALQIGRYVLHDEIAAGGMAAVHFGRLVGTGGFAKTVAIKRLHRHLVRQASFRNMILEEARLAARIRHPNVVPPLDVLGEGSELLLVMEYVHGESLSRLIKAAKAASELTPVAIVAAIFANVLHGLHAAHEARDESGQPLDIVHRDVSPQNVLVGVDGIARVIDFGIAKAVDTGEQTTAGTIKGKVPYLSPEQLDGEPATRRTDIYAASVCMWEALAGKRLMDGTDDTEILRQIVMMPIQPPSAFNGSVPASIDDVVLKGLARKPSDRFATARDMALAIEGAVHLATATQVGAWAERLAAPALRERAAKLADVESALQQDEGDDDDAPTEMLARPSPVSRAPEPPPPPPASKRAPPPSPPFNPPTVVIAPAPPPPPEPPPMTQVMSPPANTPTRPPPAGALRKPELEIPNVAWLPPPQPLRQEGQGGSRALPWLLGVIAFLALIAWLVAPFAVSALVISAAAKEGVTLTVDRVEVSRRSVRLVDVRAETAELPGVTVHAASVVVMTKLFRPHALVFDDLEVNADGAWPDVLDRIAKWRTARVPSFRSRFAEYTQISVTSGRLDWKNLASPGTSLALENVTVDMSKTGARLFGDDWRINAPLVMFRAGTVAAGPFSLDAERQGMADRVVLRLDPSGIYAASVTWSASDDGSEALAFTVPPTRLVDLHVPPAFLAGLGTDRSRVEARGEISIITSEGKRSAGGKLTLAAGDLGVFPGESRVDLSLDVPVSGDAASPIAIHGATLSLAAADPSGAPSTPVATAKLEGGLVLTRGTRLQLAGTTTPIPCAPNQPTPKSTTSLVTVLDVPLHALLESKVSMVPSNACAPRLR